MVKNPPVNAGDVRNAGFLPGSGRSRLEEGMATHSSLLSWRIPWTEEPGGLQSTGSQSRTRLKQLSSSSSSKSKLDHHGAYQVVQWMKNSPVVEETQVMQVQSLDQEDPLGKVISTYSNILAWRLPWTEEPGGLQSIGWLRVGHD